MKKLIVAIIGLLLSIAITITVAYAWIVHSKPVYNIKFSIAVVDMQITLYQVDDFDLDGIPDYNPDYGNPLAESKDEKYVCTEVFKTENATSDKQFDEILVNESHLAKRTINKFLPSQIYTYKLEVKNIGNIISNIYFTTTASDYVDYIMYEDEVGGNEINVYEGDIADNPATATVPDEDYFCVIGSKETRVLYFQVCCLQYNPSSESCDVNITIAR